MEIDEAVARIRTGPQGPTTAAFFDFDGTLVHGFSAVPFFRHFLRAGQFTAREIAATMLAGLRGGKSEDEFEHLLSLSLRSWRGHTEEEVDAIGEQLFETRIAGHLYPEGWRLVRAHQAAGHTLAIASSATRFQIEPAARALGIDTVLCTQLEVVDGVLTGKVSGRTRWRAGKADAARDFARENGIDLTHSYAYSNGGEDVEFLALVATPTAINPDKTLTAEADQRGWPTIRFRPRGTPGPVALVRTAGLYGGLAGAVTLGATGGLAKRDHVFARDQIISHAGDYMMAAAGITINVVGAANARSPRPAVFIFNHQSELDAFILAKVLRDGFSGIVKQEVALNPVIGPLFRYLGATFIDRANTAKAKSALAPVVETLRDGLSIVISPEGTRSITPTVGPFKKGAFHIALEAGVPIIPVVIRNAGEMLWKNGSTVRSGTIDVAVLDPIDLSGCVVSDLDDVVARAHKLFVDTVDNWPES